MTDRMQGAGRKTGRDRRPGVAWLCLAGLLAMPLPLPAEDDLTALVFDAPSGVTVDPGAYLAARAAARANDFAEGAARFDDALARDPDNALLLDSALASAVGLGDWDRADRLADRLIAAGVRSQLAHMTRAARAAEAGDWRAIQSDLEAGRDIGALIDGVTRAWLQVGLGEMTQALDAFDEVIDQPGLGALGRWHKALALAGAGDFEGADALLSLAPQDGGLRTLRTIEAHAQVLGQLGRAPEAVAMIDALFPAGAPARIAVLRDRLSAGEAVPFDIAPDARAGLADVYLSTADTLADRADPVTALLFARIAERLAPQDPAAILTVAQALESVGQIDLANASYRRLSPDAPDFPEAELARAEMLRRAGQTDAAAEALSALTRAHPDLAMAHVSLAHVLRMQDRTADAIPSYDTALGLIPETDPRRWFVLYARASARFDLDDWPAAETDLRAALALAPDRPQVLNFLGYGLADRGEKLDEALDLIERAVRADPENGAIVDSYGWVLFRLGRHAEAVAPMERAVQLEPADAVINDHLGDVYWAVGRTREARFQWSRALSFITDDATGEQPDPDRIRRKLEIGLDAVLAEEGAPPLSVAAGD